MLAGLCTLSAIVAAPLRDCASLIAAGRLSTPGVAPGPTVARYEKTRSPPVTSPLVSSSNRACAPEPPISVRSAVTARPVLVGLAPGVTVTVSSVVPPTCTSDGLDAPMPLGLVGPAGAVAVSAKLSTARPSSEPAALRSVQRIQKVAPAGMLRAVIAPEMAVRLAVALPSSAPVVGPVTGAVKSSASASTQVPVVRLVAFRLYWKSRRSTRASAPRRHCSPV